MQRAGVSVCVLTKDVPWEKYQEAHGEGPQPVEPKVPVPFPGKARGELWHTNPPSQALARAQVPYWIFISGSLLGYLFIFGSQRWTMGLEHAQYVPGWQPY